MNSDTDNSFSSQSFPNDNFPPDPSLTPPRVNPLSPHPTIPQPIPTLLHIYHKNKKSKTPFRIDQFYDRDTCAGALAASVAVYSLIKDGNYAITDGDLSEYLVVDNLNIMDLVYMEENNHAYTALGDAKYGIWVKSGENVYSLYRFTSARFMRGLISMAGMCEIDFRVLIHGLIFDNGGNTYIPGGYTMGNDLIGSVTMSEHKLGELYGIETSRDVYKDDPDNPQSDEYNFGRDLDDQINWVIEEFSMCERCDWDNH